MYHDEKSEFIETNPMLQTTQGKRSKLESDLFGLLQSFVYTLLVIVVVFSFVSPITRVSGASMEPTLFDNEIMLVWALGYKPKADDVVIVNNPTIEYLNGQSIVKRVVAVGGQTVAIDYEKNQVIVDGVPISEPYLSEPMRPIYGATVTEPVEVPEGFVFVLGDNRNNSADSRSAEIGMVDHRYIIGKVICGIFPVSAWRLI